ncbi:MAG: glutaredoxin family protein [Planctomycetes bacterium]|nr:glutaredoxin family protein [Planctomycetota bacterium]
MKQVKVYSTPTCPWCRKAKEYLQNKGIQFENCDVSSDRAKADEMVKLTGQMGVPVIVIDKEIIIGFDTAKIDKLLS